MKRICLAFVLSALVSAAFAAGTQPMTISSTTPTDLGVAPVFVQTLNQPVNICVADSSPTVGTQCNILQPGPPVTFYPADASSHVWASLLGSSSLIAYTPIYSSGSSISSVTQGTVPWVDDVQQWADTVLGAPSNFGTSPGAVKVPGVNAYVTDFPSTYAVTGTFYQATQPASIAASQIAAAAALDCWSVTDGCKADAANTATDTTAITRMQVEKQISKSVQAQQAAIVALGQATKANSVPVTPPADWLLGSPSAAVTGSYCMSETSGTMAAALAANAPIGSWRYGGTGYALLRKVTFGAQDSGTGFAAGVADFSIYGARSFTASDSGGNGATLTGNNGKLRTSFATTGLSDFRVSSTAALTAGTRTLDTTPLITDSNTVPTTANYQLFPLTDIFRQNVGEQPAEFAQNEGFVMEATVPATGTWFFTLTVCWDEVSAY